MFSNQYYTLVAGFREYALDAENKGFDISEILTEVEEALSSTDYKCVQLLYAYYDCENMIGLHNGSSAHNPLGRLTASEVAEELKSPSHLPESLARVLRAYAAPEGEDAEVVDVQQPFGRALLSAYYKECAASKSRFLKAWAELDRSIRNIVAAAEARRRNISIESVVVGEGEVADTLRRSSAADFGLRGELPFIEQLIAAVNDEHNMLEKERKIDSIRWNEASELSSFDYFDLNAVLAYLVKVNMVARWSTLDRKTGLEMFERLMADLDGKDLINKHLKDNENSR